MSFSSSFNVGFYSGGALTDLVPNLYPVALDGHPFLVDRKSNQFRHITIPVLKQQSQDSGNLGEQSINPQGLWRRSIESWHKGAGQTNYDLTDSDPARFRSSKGVDPWTKWELSLLPVTDAKRSSANTNLKLQPAGSRLYLIDGGDIVYTADITVDSPTWTGITGEPATAATDITSDGFNVYTAHGADRVYKTDTASSSTAAYVTSGNSVSVLGYVKGRLMAAHDNLLYNITASGALPSPLLTHDNSDFEWVDFAEGRNVIYAAGYSGDKSEIYKTAVKADGTALDTPTVAGTLPDGEIVRAVEGYLNFLLIGTDKGLRFAVQDDNGDLTIGALIETDNAVRCFEGQGSFVWFGWTNYDATDTGLGRLSLTTINDSTPAYASDLMATTQGAVLSVVTFQGVRVFTVSGVGVYGEDTVKVSSGTLDSGAISFGIPDNKVALEYDLRHDALDGSAAASISVNGSSTFTTIATSTTADSVGASYSVGELTGERFEVRLTLTRDATDTTTGPTITRHLLQMNPTADTGFFIQVPVVLAEADEIGEHVRPRDPAAELLFIENLRASRDVVTYQEGSRSYSVSLEDFEWVPMHVSPDNKRWSGTCVLTLKVL